MLEKATQELLGRKRHDSCLALMRVVLPAETHGGIANGEQAMVGDGHAMGIASQIVKDVFGSAEGCFGIDDPVLLEQSAEEDSEVVFLRKWPTFAIEHELVVVKSTLQSSHELAPKNAAENFNRQEETGTGCNPARVIR